MNTAGLCGLCVLAVNPLCLSLAFLPCPCFVRARPRPGRPADVTYDGHERCWFTYLYSSMGLQGGGMSNKRCTDRQRADLTRLSRPCTHNSKVTAIEFVQADPSNDTLIRKSTIRQLCLASYNLTQWLYATYQTCIRAINILARNMRNCYSFSTHASLLL